MDVSPTDISPVGHFARVQSVLLIILCTSVVLSITLLISYQRLHGPLPFFPSVNRSSDTCRNHGFLFDSIAATTAFTFVIKLRTSSTADGAQKAYKSPE
uniref:Uncharacterized protein n=1 Tax=Globodera rostochiensis TaxID=31243 RepID=A0A914HUS3_GLORO